MRKSPFERGRRAVLAVAAAAAAACAGAGPGRPSAPPDATAPSAATRARAVRVPDNGWSPEKKAAHLLERLAFGPSPDDVRAVVRQGPERWVASQLAPASIPDAAVEAALASRQTLGMPIAALREAYPRPQRPATAGGVEADDRAALRRARASVPPGRRPARIGEELVAQKLVRAVASRRQLQEVLTDFWFNHFNVFLGKGEDRWFVTSYERDAIRPHVLGRFRDLLGATARHPAMLWYLDNWASTREGLTRGEYVAEELGHGRRRVIEDAPGSRPRMKERLGLNENYARELLELHTLGVDGGFTQEDVREVARCFTGWSLGKAGATGREALRPRDGDSFVFRKAAHDTGAKVVLGLPIPAGGGQDDGERVLDLLARHPSTARLLATKLARRFVSDEPPASLVDRLASVYLETDGDLARVTAALASSPELWSDAAFGAKTKTPLELAASALRAASGTTDGGPALGRWVTRMGEPLYLCQPPTGYRDTAEAWIGTGSLVARLSFALALAHNEIPGTRIDVAALVPEGTVAPEAAVDALALALLHRPVSPASRETIVARLRGEGAADRVDAPLVAGLLLGSPEFQKQ